MQQARDQQATAAVGDHCQCKVRSTRIRDTMARRVCPMKEGIIVELAEHVA